MAQKYLAPDPVQSTFFIPGGAVPGNGVQVFVYLAGTTTKTTVYKDDQGVTAWSNPIVLDSGGNLPSGGSVWLTQGETIKVVWAPSNDTDPPASPYRTIDNIVGINDASALNVGEWSTISNPVYLSASSFSISGDQTGAGNADVGRRLRFSVTAGTVYGTIAERAFASGSTTVYVAPDSGALDAGLSAAAWGFLTAQNPAVPIISVYAWPRVCGRLTVAPGQPITTSDITGATSVMFTPYQGNTVDLYDSAGNWRKIEFTELSVPVPSSSTVYDVFCYQLSTGPLALTTIAWTNNTTRATQIGFISGVPTQSTQPTRLYLGSFYASTASGTTTVRDTTKDRMIWNYWSPQPRLLSSAPSSNVCTYPPASNGAWTVWGGDSSNSFRAVHGIDSVMTIDVATWCRLNMPFGPGSTSPVVGSTATFYTGVAVDAMNNGSSNVLNPPVDVLFGQAWFPLHAHYISTVTAGLHSFAHLVLAFSATSWSFIGSSTIGSFTGMIGRMNG